MKKSKAMLIIICLFLFIIPLFWLKPGEMDLGGDSTRLYYYDPQSYIINAVLYPLLGNTTGEIQYGTYSQLPHMLLLLLLKPLLGSTLLITLFNSLKLSIGFLATYGILKEIISKSAIDANRKRIVEISAILGGLFYIFSRHLVANYNMALLYHNQVFLNPLMFYLFLKYFLTLRKQYLWFALLLSFLFAPSFALISAPAFFSFFPISLIFLFFYIKFIRKQKIKVGLLLATVLIFIGLNAFQVIPQVYDVFSPGNPIHTTVFNQQDDVVRNHFYGILAISQPVINIFLPSWEKGLEILSLITPLILVIGLIFNKYRNKTILLTAIFFLITYFLVSARITWTGIQFYLSLFYIPGFAMFRNFSGVFAYVYSFFYALLFGQALFFIFSKLKLIKIKILALFIAVVIVSSSWQLINGELVNQTLTRSNNVKSFMVMDPKYEETLAFFRNFKSNGRILTLPFTDSSHQVIHGANNGAYVGASPIAFLAGKNDLSGYPLILPYSESFWELSKEANFDSIKKLLGLLDIQYIFHNNDPKVYDATFPDYPYSPDYVRKYMPANQKEYKEYVKKLTTGKIFEKGTYNLYKVDEKYFLPRFYIPSQTVLYKDDPNLSVYAKSKAFLLDQETANEVRVMYAKEKVCSNVSLEEMCSGKVMKSLPKITFEKINNIRYKVRVFGAKDSYTLVFLNQFHQDWKLIDLEKENNMAWSKVVRIIANKASIIIKTFIKEPENNNTKLANYFNGDISEKAGANNFLSPSTFNTWGKVAIANKRHFQVNGYANAWYIIPSDMQNRENYELIIEVSGQKVFFISMLISSVSLLGFIVWGLKLFLTRNKGMDYEK